MIKTGSVATQIEKIRVAKSNRDNEQADNLKKQLPAFTPSGVFGKGHRKEHLQEYNPLIVLDIDKVGSEKAAELKKKAAELATTYAAFISPSGDGLKILVQTDNEAKGHEDAYHQVADYYAQKLDVEIDQSGKDLSRLCFVSHDPEAFVNNSSKIFNLCVSTGYPEFNNPTYSVKLSDLERIVGFTDNLTQYLPGNRNNYLYKLAGNMNAFGVPHSTALGFIQARYTDPDISKELVKTVSSAYKKRENFAKVGLNYLDRYENAKSASCATDATLAHSEQTPFIPDNVYEQLPEFLKKCTAAFDIPREKDVFLTGALSILSGCFHNVSGTYDKRLHNSNLFCIIVAPPASGKGVVNYSRDLANTIHVKITKAFESNRNEEARRQIPRMHFLPADSSAMAVKINLKQNLEKGTICETEADTLTGTLQQDWGGYSDLLRKAFHHEPVTYSRMEERSTSRTVVREIKQPKLSVCLTGTPNQVPGLLKSTDDGLFSRFLFYTYKRTGRPEFKDVFSKEGITDLPQYFEERSEELFRFYEQINNGDQIRFKLTEAQGQSFITRFDSLVGYIYGKYGDDSVSIVNRLGLITFRIAMILTIIRKVEKEELASELVCEEVDFESSLLLSDTYIKHAMEVFNMLPGMKNNNRTAEILYNYLPSEFSAAEAKDISTVILQISERSAASYLKQLVHHGLLSQPKQNGRYFKVGLQ